MEIIVLPSKIPYEVPKDVQQMVMERYREYLANPDDVQDFDETIENVRKRIHGL